MKLPFLLLAVPVAAFAQGPNTLSPQEAQAGWKLLFDGKTLPAWDDPAKKTPPGNAWTVADGWIKTVPRAAMRADLVSKDQYDDFELAFEWKISAGGNSGVKYRIQDVAILVRDGRPQNKLKFEDQVEYELRNHTNRREQIPAGAHIEEYTVAFEYQTIDDERHQDALRKPVSTTGALYSLVPPAKKAARPAGEVNQSRIVLRGNHVEHWLNGEKVVDARLDTPEIAAALAARWGQTSKVYELLTKQPRKKAPISLQHHEDEAWFRSIKIRPL